MMIRIYEITYDKYYPSAPKELLIDIQKHSEDAKIDIKDIVKNIGGYEPTSYKVEDINK